MRRILTIVSVLLAVACIADAQNALGPGRVDVPFIAGQHFNAGMVTIHNNNGGLLIDVQMADNWRMVELHVHAGWAENPIPTTKDGNPKPGKFDFKYEYADPAAREPIYLDFEEDLNGFRWGAPYEEQRQRHIAVHAEVLELDEFGNVIDEQGAWAQGNMEFEGASQWCWWVLYPMAHKARTHFIDSPVHGLQLVSPTENVLTDESGSALYFPGEYGSFYLGNQLLGTTLLDHKVSPLDLFPVSDVDDPRVINMAVLLQSLDADADPKPGISITPEVTACFNQALDTHGFITDWAYTPQIDLLVDTTITNCLATVPLVKVSPEDAQINLDRSVNSNMFRKNVSRTPEMVSSKAKMNVMGVWFPAVKANGDSAPIDYFDDEGEWVRTANEAKPLVVSYTDAAANGAHDVWAAISRDDGHTWKKKDLSRMAERSSYTRLDGYEYPGECKKPVLQVKGNKILVAWTSKYARGGKPRYTIDVCPPEDPDCIVCSGFEDNEDCGPDYVYDDPYYQDDIWGVSGPQRSHDYTEDGYPEVGEMPYSAVWVARGTIVTQSMINSSSFFASYGVGDIVWFKPERLTSGRRDAYQIFMGAAESAGFGITWQEDPDGLRPGDASGPGPGWGGATTNHKTDIWYSFITWDDFAKVDTHFVSGGDPQHDDPDFIGRPKALVPMSLPVRISDNDVVNTHNMWIEIDAGGLPVLDDNGDCIPIPNPDTNSGDSDGSHRYGYMVEGLWDWDGHVYYEGGDVDWVRGNGGTLYRFMNQQGDEKTAVVTADGRALDGNTGASRPNLFMQAYTKPDGTKSAWAIMAYEETKGVGMGPDDEAGDHDGDEGAQDGSGYDPNVTAPDEGKNVIYHSFDFQNPDLVSAGTTLNFPETDDVTGEPLYVAEVPCLGSIKDDEGNIPVDDDGNYIYECNPNPIAGELITDWKGDPIFAYENARRPRFILQSKTSAFGGFKPDGTYKEPYNSGTVLIVLYKEGEEGKGRPSDIMARRCMVKDEIGNIKSGNPWSPANFIPQTSSDPRRALQNVSTMTPLETWINPDRDPNAKGEGLKVCKWEQTEDNLGHKSGANPYEDARAHRGQIRGDFVVMGYSYTPNWAASKKAHDKYDFYIRRSFNGGGNWGTDPNTTVDVVHEDIFIDPEGISGFELSEIGDDESEATKHYYEESTYGPGVFEPARNLSLIKNNKTSVIEPRIVAVPGTIKQNGIWTGNLEDKQDRNVFYMAYGTSTNLPDVEKMPEDLFYTFSIDKGTTLFEDEWIVNPDSDGNHAGETVRGWGRLAKSDAQEGEVQLRMTPDGSRFYSSWLEEGNGGNDIMFRRLTPKEFGANNAN